MAPRNSRVAPDVQVRSPARSFAQSLDTYYRPARDTRKEEALQRGLSGFSSILGEQADRMKQDRNQDEFNQGNLDAVREQAGEELQGVKNGTLFRQNSRYYMAGLNETRGKAAAAKWKAETSQAYADWEGKHIDDDGSAFRDWMNERVAGFVGGLGEDQYRLAGAMPTVNEVANNFAAQHTGFTTQRLENESFEAYDEIVSGVFSDMHNGELDMDQAIDRIAAEADDMYDTDGAAANDRVVQAAIRYANIHNDPDSILTLARAHDSGKLKLSQPNRERLANAMDAVEADMERDAAKRNAKEGSEAKALRQTALNQWGVALAEDPYAELPSFNDVGDQQTYREMVTLQDSFIKASGVENPVISSNQRMQFELDMHSAATRTEKLTVIRDFQNANPEALSAADVGKYTKQVLEQGNPGSLINDPTVREFRDNFSTQVGQLAAGSEFDINKMPFMQSRAEMHYNQFLLSKSGGVDKTDPAAIYDLTQDAQEFALKAIEREFPDQFAEKVETSPELASATGADQVAEAGQADRAATAAAEFAELAGIKTPEAGEQPDLSPVPDVPLEEQEAPFADPDDEADYAPTRAGFYGQMIQRFTDGRDDRPDGQTALKAASDVMAEDPAFTEEVNNLSSELNVPVGALIAVMDFETGGTFSTDVRNAAGSGATGLIQFMPKTAAALGTSTEELATMSRSEQMQYVRKYFAQFPQIKGGNVDDVYMAVLWPKAIGKPDGYPIFRRGTIAYRQNAGLDTNGDGTVTKFEAARKVSQKFYGY